MADLPISERVFSGFTIATRKERIDEIRSRIRRFVEELRTELAMDAEADTVYRHRHAHFPDCTGQPLEIVHRSTIFACASN